MHRADLFISFLFPSKSCVNRFDLYLCIFCCFFFCWLQYTAHTQWTTINVCFLNLKRNIAAAPSLTVIVHNRKQIELKAYAQWPNPHLGYQKELEPKAKNRKWHRIRFRCVLLFGNVADESYCMAAIFVITYTFFVLKEMCALWWRWCESIVRSHISGQRHLYAARRQNIQ